MRPLTNLVGKPSLSGGWEIPSKMPKEINVAAKHWNSSGKQFTLRVRPELVSGEVKLSGEMAKVAQSLLKQIKTGHIGVVVSRHVMKGPYERGGRMRSEVIKYPVDRPFQANVMGALMVLNRQPYSLVFEEVDDGDGEDLTSHQLASPPSPAQANTIKAMEAEHRTRMALADKRDAELDEKMARLDALLSGHEDPTKAPPKPKQKKR